MITCEEIILWRPKQGAAVVVGETDNRDAIDTEDEGLECRTHVCHAAGGIDDACLQGGCMRDLE